jgi:hypothetical protein
MLATFEAKHQSRKKMTIRYRLWKRPTLDIMY